MILGRHGCGFRSGKFHLHPLQLIVLVFLVLVGMPSDAKEAAPLAENEQVEQRLVAIAGELRCLVCQNESLAASRADLAVDLRNQIRELIKAGKSDQEILDYLVARYGDFVRYRPPVKGTTLLLWFGPTALLISGIVLLIRYLRRRASREVVYAPDAELSRDEQARLAGLLGAKSRTGEHS